MHKKDIELLRSIDREKLNNAIAYFFTYRKVEWSDAKQVFNGVDIYLSN